MKFLYCFLTTCFFCASLAAQSEKLSIEPVTTIYSYTNQDAALHSKKKLFQRNQGAIIGIQKGASTAIELGGEAHWRKMSLFNPHIIGASTNLEYNIGDHVLGYKAGAWMKRGRVNLTYGGNLVYFTDFEGHNCYGIGPAVGFRLAGFHLINGYNFLAGDEELEGANTLHMTLRYYFSRDNTFTWDRKTMKKKAQRKKEKEKKKKERENEEKKDLRKLFDLHL